MALLDTTVLIDLGRNPRHGEHRRAHAVVQQLLAEGDILYTSRINEAELLVGVEASRNRQHELERAEAVLAGIIILEFDATSARQYAIAKAALQKIGRPSGDCDTLIASVALANGQAIVTRNSRHFDRIAGLIVRSY